MIKVNTNLASMLVLKNFKSSTNSLNTAIERLTTGFRINSAKDDAVGKAVSIDMDVKLSSNEVAQNNVSMGVSLLNTAEGQVNLIKDKVQRCRDLCAQAMNGVYDSDAQTAIKAELRQLVDTVNNVKESSNFNGISLFEGGDELISQVDRATPDTLLVQTQPDTGFIDKVNQATVSTLSGSGTSGFMTSIEPIDPKTVIDAGVKDIEEAVNNLHSALDKGQVVGISNELGLIALAHVVESGRDCHGATIVLTDDIDLKNVGKWNPIGDDHTPFAGDFNGNGHTISNMWVSEGDFVGLFGMTVDSKISNTALINVTVSGTGECVGGLVGVADHNSSVTNCYVTGTVSGENEVGGLVGVASDSSVTYSYATGSVSGKNIVGGLVGLATAKSSITYSYAAGSVSGAGGIVGGLVGDAGDSYVTDSTAYTSVSGRENVGGFAGKEYGACFAHNTYVDDSSGHAVGNVDKDVDGITLNKSATPPSSGSVSEIVATVGGTKVSEALSLIGNLVSLGATTIGLTNVVALQAFAEYVNTGHNCAGLTFCLTGDIDLKGAGNWTPIGRIDIDQETGNKIPLIFSGAFNGNGYAISNMSVSGTNNVGLFGYVSGGTISNTALIDATVSGTGVCVGGLVGYANRSSVTNSYATGSVSGTDYVGGLVGSAEYNSSVTDSYVTGSVSGKENIGGLVGVASGSSVTNSYVSGSVSGTDTVGGLVGYAYYHSSITDSYATGSVSGTDYVGGLVGGAYYYSSVTDSTAYTSVSGTGSAIGGFLGYNYDNTTTFSNNTYVDDSSGHAVGNVDKDVDGITLNKSATPPSSGSVSEIVATVGGTKVSEALSLIGNLVSLGATTIGLTNVVALQAFAEYVNTGHNCAGLTFCLTGDIDLKGAGNWTPIGNSTNKFQGNFNGNGYTISNMTVTGTNHVGLFGWIEGSTISNTALINATVSGTGNYVGGLVGCAGDSSVTNSYATGTVSGTNYVGGLVGWAEDYVSITSSYAAGTVSGTNNVGGLVGNAVNNSSVTNSYSTGTVSGTNRVGGLVGDARYSSVTNSYASGSVSGINYVGGLVGQAWDNSSVTDSTAYTSVSGTGSNIGGFLGKNHNNTTTFSDNTYVDDSTGHAVGNTERTVSGITLNKSATPPSKNSGIKLQIGLDGGVNSQITLNLSLNLSSLDSILMNPASGSNLATLDTILSNITSVETQIGAGLNRLESVQDSLLTQQKTLTAARSIVMDADVSQESARYIRSQILQQASASLLTVANQSPSLLLSLINGMIR